MNKLIDEYDIEITPADKVLSIDLYGVIQGDDGYIYQCDDVPEFYSVYRIEDQDGERYVCVGDFSDIEDAKAYANQLCEKYEVGMVNHGIRDTERC